MEYSYIPEKDKQKIKYGMIGGGPDSFIGPIHRNAANLDGKIEIICGCFSSTAEKSFKVGNELYLEKYRIYKIIDEMILEESRMPPEERMDFVAIVTPNHLHHSQAKLALSYGFNVLIDKPLSMTLDEALELKALADEKKLLFCITYSYTGYPMVKEAKSLLKSGKLGKIRKICVEYPQQWLSISAEKTNKQAQWRTDPNRAGIGGCIADIGVHAFNLIEYVSGLKVIEICADLTTFVEGRLLDDDSNILLKLENEAKGILQASQVLSGEENSLRLCVWAEKGSIEWNHSDCNSLKVKWSDKPSEIYRAGNNYSYLSENARKHCRTPGGHPEGFLEAFANIYRNFAMDIAGKNNDRELYDYPTINDGVRGMLFIEKVVESSKSDLKWTDFSIDDIKKEPKNKEYRVNFEKNDEK